MSKADHIFLQDLTLLQSRYRVSKQLAEFQEHTRGFCQKWRERCGVGDQLLNLSEAYIADGDREAGTILLLAVAEFFPDVNNTTCFYLRLAQLCFERGNECTGISYLVMLCNAVSNYEESIAINGLTDIWLKYKHYVESKVQPSLPFQHTASPLPPEQCSMQITEILNLPHDEILSALSAHLGELSANGESVAALNQWEKTVFYADQLCTEVNSGGFEGYLYYYGENFENALHAFDALDAQLMLPIMERVLSKFPRKKIPQTLDDIQSVMEQMEEAEVDFDAEDSAYYDSGEKELLAQLLAFVLANKSHFR